jgi:uncharacterized glyoxalase superfamily protein PhnB
MTTTTALQVKNITTTMTVNDVNKSLKFYTDGLGFTVTDRMEQEGKLHGVMLQAGNGWLGISQDDFSKGRDRVKGVGMRLYLETDQDIEALAQQAKAAGITLDQGPGPLPWGPIGFTVTDPDGFKLTVSKPETK